MKRTNKYLALGAVVMAVGLSLGSCVAENPFEEVKSLGNGSLSIATAIRGEVEVSTRAEADYDQTALEDNLVVYVERLSNVNGDEPALIRKFIGKHTLPSSLSLPAGEYVVEGWTGDSVSASWDKKFYRGYQPVTIRSEEANSVELHCNIANVIVSVDAASLDSGITDMKLSFSHSRKGENNEYVMTFGENEINNGAKAYFMMPTANHSTGEKESIIYYEIIGSDGVIKEGELNVQAAHEYKIKVKADQSATSEGGALILLEIADIPVIDKVIDIFPGPRSFIDYGGKEVALTEQIDLTTGVFNETTLKTVIYKGVQYYSLSFSENFSNISSDFNQFTSELNLIDEIQKKNGTEAVLKNLGILYDRPLPKYEKILGTDSTIQVDEITLKIDSQLIKGLPASSQEYVISIEVTDGFSNTSSVQLRYATSENALDAPIGTPDPSKNVDYTAITPYTAKIKGVVYKDNVTGYGIKYRKEGASTWIEVLANETRAGVTEYQIALTGLTPGTTYEYVAYCDGFIDKTIRKFTTESIFTIPNAGLEDWSTLSSNSKVLLPAAGGTVSFWDTGNHGSATMSKLVTNYSETMKHGGAKSAELKSQFVGLGIIGKFAAGNLFVGSYDKTDGTDGELTFGRPYNGSHPVGLTLYANYRPGITDKNGANNEYLNQGATDKGQIYVALTSSSVSVKTKTKELFDPNADYVVAYGQITLDEAFGADGILEKVSIPLDYKSRAKNVKPTHLVIVCSASKYGDFFCGGEGSLLYVDDFELEY